MFCRRHSDWEMIVALTWLCSNCTNSGWHCQWLTRRKLVNPFKQLKSRSSLFLKLNNDKTSNFKWLLTKLELSCVRNIIPRSKSGASKSRPRWAAHTRIGNVWEYPPPCLLVQGGEAKYFLCFSIQPNCFWCCERYADFMRDVLKRSSSRVHKPSEVREF